MTNGTIEAFTESACMMGGCGDSMGSSHLLRPLMPAMLVINTEKVSLTVTVSVYELTHIEVPGVP